MHVSQNVHHFVIWYHQPTFEHQERTVIVEVCMTLLGELPVTFQGRITILSNMDVSQLHRTQERGYHGRKRSRNMRESIRDEGVLAFSMNYRDTREEVGYENIPAKLLSTQVEL